MRRLLALSFTTIIVATAWWFVNLTPVASDKVAGVEFVITKRQSVDQIGENLIKSGLIRSPLAFKITVYLLQLSSKIQAGYFFLYPTQSTISIAKSLTKATTKQVWITIPEGLRRQEIANLIIDKLQASKTKHNFDPDQFIRDTTKLEGQLFPDTYAFSEGVTTKTVVDTLYERYLEIMYSLTPKQDMNRWTTLASLVEKEAGNDSERPIIAGIIQNRLNSNWPLQIDATVQYALSTSRCRIRICDWWPQNLNKEDLKIASAYNTYLNAGLPPSPISNPGLQSLKAAASPVSTKYFFYLHGLDGQVHYATTISEHNKNICLYLKKSC